MPPRSIIIDADPGNDDAVALLLALASPELATRGVTTVAGNVPLTLTTRNARAIGEFHPIIPLPASASSSPTSVSVRS